MTENIFKTDSFIIKIDNNFPITVLVDKDDESSFKEGNDYKGFEGIEEYRKIREIVDLSISKMPMKEEKGIFNKDGTQKYSKNFLDIEHIIYTHEADIAMMISMDYQNGEIRDILFRGGDILDIVVFDAKYRFPNEATTIKDYPDYAVLSFYINDNEKPKCERCWKRYNAINSIGLCVRCNDVIVKEYPHMLNKA